MIIVSSTQVDTQVAHIDTLASSLKMDKSCGRIMSE